MFEKFQIQNKSKQSRQDSQKKILSNPSSLKSKSIQYPQSQGNPTQFQKLEIKLLPAPNSKINYIKSYCRIRPNNTQENCINNFEIAGINNTNLIVDYSDSLKEKNKIEYNFTKIFNENTLNKDIYINICEPAINDLLNLKRSGIIFVYGVTNSGKTYTVNGNRENPGILPLSLYKIFQFVQNYKKKLEILCTYVEIYNEEIFDLFSYEKNKVKLCGSSDNFFLKNAIIKKINSLNDLNEALTLGINQRTINSTNLNNISSRSHSIFRIEINFGENEESCSFSIADLAGIERANRAGTKGENLKETGQINNSLLILRKCFDAMEQNSNIIQVEKKVRVPIRESKLTMLMKEYLNGNKNVIMICTINPNISDMFDNKNVLHFASKAQKVKPIKSWIEQIKKVNSKLNKGIISKKVYKMYTTSNEHKKNHFNWKKNNKTGNKKENKDNLNSNSSSLNNSVVDSSSEFSEEESDYEISNKLTFSNETNNKMNILKRNNNKNDISSFNNFNQNNNEDKISDNEKNNLLQKQKIIDYIEYREEYNNEINRYETNYEIYKNICLGLKNYDLGLPYKSKTYILINPFNKKYKEEKKINYETTKETEFEIKAKEKPKTIFTKIKNYFTIESSRNNSNNNSICSENEFEVISKIKQKKINESSRKARQKKKLIEKNAFTDISDLSNIENNFESIPEKEEESLDDTKKKISGIFKKKSVLDEIEIENDKIEFEFNKKENKKKTKKNCKKSKKKITISDYGSEDENDASYSDFDYSLELNKKMKKAKSKKTNKKNSIESSSEKKNVDENEDEKKTKKRNKGKSKKRK